MRLQDYGTERAVRPIPERSSNPMGFHSYFCYALGLDSSTLDTNSNHVAQSD